MLKLPSEYGQRRDELKVRALRMDSKCKVVPPAAQNEIAGRLNIHLPTARRLGKRKFTQMGGSEQIRGVHKLMGTDVRGEGSRG
jgi:hypothetical protein